MRRGSATKGAATARTRFQALVLKLIQAVAFVIMGYSLTRMFWRGTPGMGGYGEGGARTAAPWAGGWGWLEPGLREHVRPTEDSTQERARIWAEEAQRTPLKQGEERSFQE